jgi:hypothetical protein
MSLVRVELLRFFSRRAVAALLVAAAVLTALIAATTIWNSRPPSAAEMASAHAQVQVQVASPQFQEDLTSCRDDPEGFFGPGAGAADCTREMTPTQQSYLSRSRLSLEGQRGTGGIAVVVIIAALMIIAGATFAGGDWATGSMTNQMIFEPRRWRVWVTKGLAVTLACAGAAALLLVGFWAALFLTADSRGIGTAPLVQHEIGWLVARGVVLCGLVGLGGYALTMLLRSTVATLALLFAYAAGGEAIVALAPVDRSGLWSLTNNLFAWLRNGIQVFDGSVVCGPTQPMCSQQYTVSLVHGSAFLGALLGLTLVVSAVVFRRRDIL